MYSKSNLSRNAGRTAVPYRKNTGSFFKIDNRFSKRYEYPIKQKQVRRAPMERWGMLELIKKSGIELSQREKENLLIFGDIRGWEWTKYEIEKLRYEFDNINDIAEVK